MNVEDAIIPFWLAAPPAVLTMLILAGHVMALQKAEMPEKRRRIRTANGMVMLVTTPLIAYAMSIAKPAEPKTFVLVWMAIVGLLGIVIVLACLDALLTMVMRRRELQDAQIRLRAAAVRAKIEQIAEKRTSMERR